MMGTRESVRPSAGSSRVERPSRSGKVEVLRVQVSSSDLLYSIRRLIYSLENSFASRVMPAEILFPPETDEYRGGLLLAI
ncbi:hypothetical protein SCLCIDRAFT_1029158 [Scleroderma citrinum Foug A]|uniref:Uncharacterized protein n=1 Tax=Scleroderma citrinum Foug A TaxID=1036808 RepID=A0A0C3DTP8_9AGAM|nr:hypothetical protein SCLCIDRAFT_1029158 [Scleroderma citrinum Foug A]